MIKLLDITKEHLEEAVGCNIKDFRLDPIYNKDVCIGLSVRIILETNVDHISIKGVIASSDEDKKCKELGIEGNYKLLQYLEGLEQNIERLKNELKLT